MLSETCLDPILDRLPAEHLVSVSTRCITSLLQVPNTMALMFWIRALQSAWLIQGLGHKSICDICSASSTTLFLSGAYEKGFTLCPVCQYMFSLPCAPAALLQLCSSLQDSAEHMPGHNQEIQEWEKVIKGRGRWEVSVSTLLHLFEKHCLLSQFDSV